MIIFEKLGLALWLSWPNLNLIPTQPHKNNDIYFRSGKVLSDKKLEKSIRQITCRTKKLCSYVYENTPFCNNFI